jgi:hypothetical protein
MGRIFSWVSRALANPVPRSNQTYISPSDNIMSPCTAKLSGLKNKHFLKYVEPALLFCPSPLLQKLTVSKSQATITLWKEVEHVYQWRLIRERRKQDKFDFEQRQWRFI